MLRIKWADADGVERAVQFDDDRMLNTEAIQLKKVTGLTFKQVINGINDKDPEAATALVWLARRRHGEPELRLSEVEFDVGSLDVDLVDEEGRVYWVRASDRERVYVDGAVGEPDPTSRRSATPAAS